MLKTFSIWLTVLGCLHGQLKAQTAGAWHLTDADGLPSNTVYQITEDRNGYILLGTAAGLVRFNGFAFETIKNQSARSADASSLQMDKKGRLWFSNFNHELFRLNTNGAIEKIAGIDVSNFNAQGQFVADAKGYIWFNSRDRLYVMDGDNLQIREHPSLALISGSWNILEGRGIINTNPEVRIYPFGSKYPEIIVPQDLKFNPAVKLPKPIIIYDLKRKFLVQSLFPVPHVPEGLQTLDLNQFSHEGNVQNLCMLSDSSLWICTSRGIQVFDSHGKPKYNGRILFKGKNMSNAYRDSRGNFWVSSLTDGLFMVSNFDVESEVWYNEWHESNGISHLRVHNNQLLMGTQDGTLIKMDKDGHETHWKTGINRSIYHIFPLPGGGYVLNLNYYPAEGSFHREISILSAPKGFIVSGDEMIYSNNAGLRREKLSRLKGDNQEIVATEFTMEWRNAFNSIVKSERLRLGNQLLNGRGGRLFQDSKGRIWIGSSAGIYWLNMQDKRLTRIELTPGSQAMAQDFAEDSDGHIWIAVANEGIVEWTAKGIGRKYGLSNGLLSVNSKRLLWAGGRLWIASAEGLNALNPANNKLQNYRISDGLISNDIQDIAFFNDRIWVATFKGVNHFPATFESDNPYPPVLFVNLVSVNGKTLALKNGQLQTLKSDENNVEFHFEALNYKSRNLLTYRYRLRGQSDNWVVIPGSTGHVLFQGLPPGDYIFELLAYNDKGVSTEKAAIVRFTITEILWKKAWFWMVLVLTVAAVGFVLWRRQQLEIQKKLNLENELRLSQLASLKSQMNPHFMFNALNSIQDFILLNDKTSANTFLGKFSDMMRLVLDMSNQADIPVSAELRAIQLYLDLESLRFEENFTYNIQVDPTLDITDWRIPSMIIQPFVENAIKHGLLHKRGTRELDIQFAPGPRPSTLKVTIEDNGVGRKEAGRIQASRVNRHSSFATGATQRRLELLNRNQPDFITLKYDDLLDTGNQPAGTRVTLIIPMNSIKNAQNKS
ncbi:MAG: histidine kinase [Bacteroidetes bacterium]|nr:histidine kinase [Bacteroidota bacterium]